MNIVGGAARPEENGKAVVFVNLHYYPDVAAAGQHLQDLAEYLASRGCRVEVFSGRTSYQGDSLDAPSTERRGGVQVTRLRTPIFGRRDVAGRLFGYAIFLVRTSVRLFFRRRERVIFLTTPPLLPVAGYLLRLLRLGPRYAIWSMDLHPEAEIAVGILSSSSVVTRLLRWLDARAFTEADFVVAVGQRMRERLQEKGVAPGQVYVVPGWADGEELVPVARECNPLVGFLGLETKFVVCYSGRCWPNA